MIIHIDLKMKCRGAYRMSKEACLSYGINFMSYDNKKKNTNGESNR